MTIQQFIERAIEGGWKPDGKLVGAKIDYCHDGIVYQIERGIAGYDGDFRNLHIAQILLDPSAWKAVGKVEGYKWKAEMLGGVLYEGWVIRMDGLIPALRLGKTIEQYLETL